MQCAHSLHLWRLGRMSSWFPASNRCFASRRSKLTESELRLDQVNPDEFGSVIRGEKRQSLRRHSSKEKQRREEAIFVKFHKHFKSVSPVSREADTFGTLTLPKSSLAEVEQDFGKVDARRNDNILAKAERELSGEDERRRLGKQHPPEWYRDQCQKLAREGKMDECVAMLEVRMLKWDKIDPKISNFHVVLKAVAAAGYTRKAFEIYETMTAYGFVPDVSTYAMLFISCAKCPFPEYGLKQASELRNMLKERNLPLNRFVYNSMVQAFARHGQLTVSCEILDEMVSEGMPPDLWSFNVLLTHASEDPKIGFPFCLRLIHLMRRSGIQRSPATYTALLNACLKGGVSNVPSTLNLANSLLPKPKNDRKPIDIPVHYGAFLVGEEAQQIEDSNSKLQTKVSDDFPEPLQALRSVKQQLNSPHKNGEKGFSENALPDSVQSDIFSDGDAPNDGEGMAENSNVPNAVIDDESLRYGTSATEAGSSGNASGEMVNIQMTESASMLQSTNNTFIAEQTAASSSQSDLAETQSNALALPAEKLASLGGVKGFFAMMRHDRVKPSVIQYTQLLDCLPKDGSEGELHLLSLMDRYDVEPSMGFLKRLIKRRAEREDLGGVKVVLEKLEHCGFRPDLSTFEFQIPLVRSADDASQLMQKIDESSLKPGPKFFSTLLTRACTLKDSTLAAQVIAEMTRRRVLPRVEAVNALYQLAKEFDQLTDLQIEFLPAAAREGLADFRKEYKRLLRYGKIHTRRHPWANLERPVPLEKLYRPHERQKLATEGRFCTF